MTCLSYGSAGEFSHHTSVVGLPARKNRRPHGHFCLALRHSLCSFARQVSWRLHSKLDTLPILQQQPEESENDSSGGESVAATLAGLPESAPRMRPPQTFEKRLKSIIRPAINKLHKLRKEMNLERMSFALLAVEDERTLANPDLPVQVYGSGFLSEILAAELHPLSHILRKAATLMNDNVGLVTITNAHPDDSALLVSGPGATGLEDPQPATAPAAPIVRIESFYRTGDWPTEDEAAKLGSKKLRQWVLAVLREVIWAPLNMEPVYSPPDVFHAKYRPDWWPAVSPTQIVSQLTKREHLLIYKNAMNALRTGWKPAPGNMGGPLPQ